MRNKFQITMEDKIKINYPDSEKVYMPGSLYPELRVGMRRVRLTPTVVVKDGEKVLTENPPVYIYDTSGAYSDPAVPIDLRKGLPRLREEWIRKREVERLPGITSEYGRARLADRSLDHLRFEHIQLPYRAKEGCQVTQMYYAKQGIITPEMEIVAKKEYRTTEEIRQWVAEGKVAIPANKHHTCLNPEGVGSMLRTKINVNLGVSRDCKDYNIEMQKVMSAVNMGAEAIMDLSSHGNTQPFRQKLTHECPVMIGTVPVYDSVIHYQRDLAELTAQDFIDVVRLHAEDGVDFVTLHCGITRKTIEQIRKHKRKMNIVSRGGSLVFAWMSMTGNENPFYEHFDEICEICAEHDVTISLGDACRPGCLADATDVCQIEELVRLGELTKRAWAHNVQVMVEGPGHVPLNQVAANMEVQKSICMGAPFYVLGPLVTDIAPGYDHITSAIGGAIAAANGADFLCYVTPAEHLRLPDTADVKEGIIASRIAAHAADIAKGVPHARDLDNKMAEARHKLDWDEMFKVSVDPDKARAYFESTPPADRHTCSMCGKMCAVRTTNLILDGKKVEFCTEL